MCLMNFAYVLTRRLLVPRSTLFEGALPLHKKVYPAGSVLSAYVQVADRFGAGHPRLRPRRPCRRVDMRDHAARQHLGRISDGRAAVIHGNRRHARRVKPAQAADACIFQSDPGIVKHRRAAPRPEGKAGGKDTAMRAGDNDASPRAVQLCHAVRQQGVRQPGRLS